MRYEDAFAGYTAITYLPHRGRLLVINLGTIWIWKALRK
jgi:hypothetical protein